MCPTCALLELHLVIHGSPTQFESPEPAQRQKEGPGADEVLETPDDLSRFVRFRMVKG
jgi:hypothetical protein